MAKGAALLPLDQASVKLAWLLCLIWKLNVFVSVMEGLTLTLSDTQSLIDGVT